MFKVGCFIKYNNKKYLVKGLSIRHGDIYVLLENFYNKNDIQLYQYSKMKNYIELDY